MTARDATVADLLDRLTREEKLRLVRGGVDPSGAATGYVPPVERLGIPACSFTDGPMGVRAGTATAFPASIALAAAWDPGLAEEFGAALASEARAKGFDGVLAPALNLVRVPQSGRVFEYYGEDPLLTARTAAATVRGVESMDVLATPKHYVANNQETGRLSVSAEVGERALRELYLPGFRAAVRAGAGAVMAAYNRVDGTYVAEHERLLTGVLKGEFGFDGVVMSDWQGVRDATAAATAGLDLEMPGVALYDLLTDGDGRPVGPRALRRRWPPWLPDDPGDLLRSLASGQDDDPAAADMLYRSPFARSLPEALERGVLSESRLDDMVGRLLAQYARIGLLDADARRPAGAYDAGAHRDLAERIAVRGTVLLTDDADLLPLSPGAVDRLAVVGPNADAARLGGAGGGGSSEVTPARAVGPLDGLRERAGDDVTVGFAPGAWYGGRLPLPASVQSGALGRLASTVRPLVESVVGSRLDAAVRAAEAADVAVVVVEDAAAEGVDRDSLALPGRQDRLVRAVARTGTPTVVALATSGPVEMPWLDAVDAALQCWYGGQEAGAALAAVLFGDADPGGRLPVTFGRAAADYPANTTAQYPGVDRGRGYREASYSEGVFVGYRHFDAEGVEPLFPFGHGESYAAFAYRDLAVAARGDRGLPAAVRVTVENVGDRPGREVVQAYAGARGGRLPRPPRELAGFAPLALDPGEAATVEVPLCSRAFAAYDPDAGWVVDADEFDLAVGRSSRDLRLSETVSTGST